MKKLTVTQAIEAIKAEPTTEGIEAVLMQCTKADMVRVHDELTGHAYGQSVNGTTKEVLASYVAWSIQKRREDDAFRALSVSEKLTELKELKWTDLTGRLYQCTVDELKELAVLLGVKANERDNSLDIDFWVFFVEDALKAQRVEGIVKEMLKAGASGAEVHVKLYNLPIAIVAMLMLKAGLKAYNCYEEGKNEAVWRLTQHYVEMFESTPLEDAEYSDAGGDNSAPEQDIPEAHTADQIESEAEEAVIAEEAAECAKEYETHREYANSLKPLLRELSKKERLYRPGDKDAQALRIELLVKEWEYLQARLECLRLRKRLKGLVRMLPVGARGKFFLRE